jgi:hypothetical protein
MKITKSQLKKIIAEELQTMAQENNLEEEQVDEGYLDVGHGLRDDKERCQRYAERKNEEYGGGTRYYYNDCMERAGSSGGGSSPSYASTGWAGRKSHDHMSDIGRFEEGKIKKSDLFHIIREEIVKLLEEKNSK